MCARREGDSAKKQNNSITRTVKTEWSTYIASLLWSSGQMFWFESQQGGLSTIKSSIWNTIAEIDKTINNIHGGEEPNWEWKSWLKPLATSIIQIFFFAKIEPRFSLLFIASSASFPQSKIHSAATGVIHILSLFSVQWYFSG